MPQSEGDRAESLAVDWLRFAFGERYGGDGQALLDLVLSRYGSMAKAAEAGHLDDHALLLLAGIKRLGPTRLSPGVTVRDLEWFGTYPDSPEPRGAWTIEVFNQWVALGRSIEDLRYAVAAGLRFDLLKEWFVLVDPVTGRPMPVQDCLAWRRTKFSPPEATRWIARGWPAELAEQARRLALDPGSAEELRRASGSFDKALELAQAGITSAADVALWLDSGWSIERLLSWRKARFTPSEASRWLSAGVPSPSRANEYERAGVSPDRFGEVARVVGSSTPGIDEWLLAALSIEEIREWVLLRNVSAREAIWFKSRGISPDRFAEIKVLIGRADPTFASWARSDFDQGEIRSWIDAGIADASGARAWIKQGFTAEEVARWLPLGVSEPLNARVWADMGYRPASTDGIAVEVDLRLISEVGDPVIESVEKWMSSSFAPSTALLWSQGGIDPDTAWAYDRAGMTAKKLVPLLLAGLDLDDAIQWTKGRPHWDSSLIIELHKEGHDPDVIQEWVKGGFSLREAGEWSASGFERLPAKKWRDAGFSPDEASEWITNEVEDPSNARSFDGISPADVSFCRKSGMTWEELLEALDGADTDDLDDPISTLRALSPHVSRWRTAVERVGSWVLLARVCNYDAALAGRLFDALGRETDPSLLAVSSLVRSQTETLLRLFEEGAEISDVLSLVQSGEPDDRVLAKLAKKLEQDSSNVRPDRPEGVPPGSKQQSSKTEKSAMNPAQATKWTSTAMKWLRRVGLQPSENLLELFGWARHCEWEWLGETDRIFSWFDDDSREWLAHCQERALSSRPAMRKAVTDVEVFVDHRVSIALCVDDETVVAWVGDPARKKGLLVAFREEDFAPLTDESDRRVNIATGLATSWYVDCTIVIKSPSSRPTHSFRRETPSLTSGARVVRYIPTPSFSAQVEDVQSGRLRVLSGCWVKPHIRTLPSDRTPDPEHVAQAPEPLRRRMTPDQTWVTQHERLGGATAQEFETRLSKYSSLADALGLALGTGGD
jgi:hypothetical protein